MEVWNSGQTSARRIDVICQEVSRGSKHSSLILLSCISVPKSELNLNRYVCLSIDDYYLCSVIICDGTLGSDLRNSASRIFSPVNMAIIFRGVKLHRVKTENTVILCRLQHVSMTRHGRGPVQILRGKEKFSLHSALGPEYTYSTITKGLIFATLRSSIRTKVAVGPTVSK